MSAVAFSTPIPGIDVNRRAVIRTRQGRELVVVSLDPAV
jgi:hypothetical protein